MKGYLRSRAFILCCLFVPAIVQSQVQKIYLHPKAAGGGRQSQFVDSIRFIPFEIKEGVEIGAYNNIQVTEKYFLITDYVNKIFLLYAKDGSFIKKINYKKLGNSFFPNYNERNNEIVLIGNNKNYSLTPKDELKIMLDWDNPRNKKYFKKFTIDLNDTTFAIAKAIPNQNDIAHAYHFYDEFYCQGQINTSELFKDSLDYEFKIYKNNQLVKAFFPYNHINEPRFLYSNEGTGIGETDTPYVHFLTRPYCDTVYKIIRDSLFAVYQLVLPLENSLPPTFFTKPFRNKSERENFNRNNGWMLRQINSFYETKRLMCFSVRYLYNYDFYIHDKKNNVTYKAKNIKPDTSQYNLQLLGDYNTIRKGDKFYKTQKAGELVSFFEQHKSMAVPKELESFLKSNPPAATPVVIEFKLKN